MKTRDRRISWQGQALLQAGLGAFYGKSGDNQFHQHWAHQIVLSKDAPFTVYAQEQVYVSRAIWIDAGTSHKLDITQALCLYLDPSYALSSALKTHTKNPQLRVSEFPNCFVERWSPYLGKEQDLQSLIDAMIDQYRSIEKNLPTKLNKVLKRLEASIAEGNDATREELALYLHISPSRFSHWFREETGIALRSYKKWLRLIHAFRLLSNSSLTESALDAGFSDQAHFSRAVFDAFGVTPKQIQKLLSQ